MKLHEVDHVLGHQGASLPRGRSQELTVLKPVKLGVFARAFNFVAGGPQLASDLG